jgi:VWFA-related protein
VIALSDTRRKLRSAGWSRKRIARALLIAVCVLGVVPSGFAASQEVKAALENLPEHWRVWLEDEVYPLITKEQRRAFLGLETEAQRQAFAERLWIMWGRQTGYGSSFRWTYEERLNFCRVEFDNTAEERARVLLIHGPPAIRYRGRCPEFFSPLEVWVWPYIEGLGEGVTVLFYQTSGMGRWRMWYSLEGRRALYNPLPGAESRGFTGGFSGSRLDSPRYRCPDGDTLMNLIAAAEFWSKDPRVLQAMTQFQDPEKAGPESASRRFMEFSALLDKDSEPLDFSVSEQSWGTRGGLIHMGFAINVDVDGLGTTPVGDVAVVQLDVIGEISRATHMVDRFRYVFSLPAAEEDLALMVERFVRPGNYSLRLKVEDVHSKLANVSEHHFTASVNPTGRPPAEVLDVVLPSLGVAATASVNVNLDGAGSEETPILRLVGPEGEAISGLQRFEAVLRDDQVKRVTFLVNGEAILTKNRPPFDVDLDMGPLPRLTTVSAVGYDRSGEEIMRDRLSMNVGRERFYLRLKPLTAGEAESGKVKVGVDVNIPSDVEFEKLDLFWNDKQLATLYEEPFEDWVTLEKGGGFGYLRAVATMSDGSMAEDLYFVNAPEFGTVVDVTAVELPVAVIDKDSGKPVENLSQDDFSVFEDGVKQTISHFALHRDVPVRLGIVVDTSGSMDATLPKVQEVVMGFLRDLLRPRDRAFIETFSDQADVLASFTADFVTLENALLALFADRSTALYDSIIVGLFQYSGVRGRKAMVVLTDGEDTASKYEFEDVVGYAQRAGVTIYTIAIDLSATKVVARWQLGKLAEMTGGRSFFISNKSELDRIYSEIDRELRTQYLLAYTSNSEKEPNQLRKIKVEVDRRRTKVRTISGYFPGGI